jgi:hypothetical protein
VRDDDTELRALLTRSGFTATGDTSGDTWMAAANSLQHLSDLVA